MKKRNSLIELYRFFFALNVVKSHSFFPEGFNYFSPGRVSVEFFFVLSGFLFVHTLDKIKDMPLPEGLWRLIKGKLAPIFLPLAIGLLSNVIRNVISGDYFSGIWSYLWYVEAMMLAFTVIFVLRKLIKRDKAFWYTVAVIFLVATLMRFSGIFYSWGYVRAASTVPLGMLIAKLPKLKIKQWLVWAMLIPTQAACFIIVCFSLGNVEWWGGFMGIELILDLVLYPALIYLTFLTAPSSCILNYLGALSFGLYAFQCPAELMRSLGIESRGILLTFIVTAAILEDAVKRILKWRANREDDEAAAAPKA